MLRLNAGHGHAVILAVVQFGGARLLTSRLARTLAPPKMQTVPLPNCGQTNKTPRGNLSRICKIAKRWSNDESRMSNDERNLNNILRPLRQAGSLSYFGHWSPEMARRRSSPGSM